MDKTYYLIVFFNLLIYLQLNNAQKLKSCNLNMIEPCPLNSMCSQNTTNICICKADFDFNANFHNDTDYCKSNPKSKNKSILPLEVDTTSAANLYQTKSTPVGSHHIIGGILIPVFIVLIVIGAAYGLKRLEVIRRIREFRMRRRRQPFYEDVMMNQDNDDPPLSK